MTMLRAPAGLTYRAAGDICGEIYALLLNERVPGAPHPFTRVWTAYDAAAPVVIRDATPGGRIRLPCSVDQYVAVYDALLGLSTAEFVCRRAFAPKRAA